VIDVIADALGALGTLTGVGGLALGARANRTSREAKEIARNALAIEARAYHDKITPHLEVTWREPWNSDHQNAMIEIKLVGPDGVDRLDAIEAFVRDDKARIVDHPRAGSYTQEDINRQVWGPYRFGPGIDHASADGRRVAAFDLNRSATHRLQMERTQPGWWMGSSPPDIWRNQYKDHPVRLTFVCRMAGQEQWTVPVDVVREPDRVSRSWEP
jgi:hypothetical protein